MRVARLSLLLSMQSVFILSHQQAIPSVPPVRPRRRKPRKNTLGEEVLQVHHQKRELNHHFGGQRQVGHQTSSPKPALALPKLAFNGHPGGGISVSGKG